MTVKVRTIRESEFIDRDGVISEHFQRTRFVIERQSSTDNVHESVTIEAGEMLLVIGLMQQACRGILV